MSLDFGRRSGNHFRALKRHRRCPPARPHRHDRQRFHLTPRRAPILAALIALLAVAACATSTVVPTPSAPTGAVSTAPDPTPVVTPTPVPTLAPSPTAPTDEGNVEGDIYPELTVETADPGTLRITLDDPSAKAWRLVVAGSDALAYDRLEIEVVTSDVEPLIHVREIRDSEVVDEMDLSWYGGGLGAAGGCHANLHVCIDSDGFRLPEDGNGRFRVRLSVADAVGPLAITGSTAGWPGEPFVLGPWVDTDPFVWSA
jgi:hypothetical protein